MNVYLTFDIEIWCNGWEDLDGRYPPSFERYVYGRSAKGNYALPKTLEILSRYGLKGVFFVEPLFAARFGIAGLEEIVGLIKSKGHDIQLHLHPEWADEIRPLIFEGARVKRQHLSFYTLDEQFTLIELGKKLLKEAGGGEAKAFRAGSFAANADTYRALSRCGIHFDSSLNLVHSDSGLDLREELDFSRPQRFEGVSILPMTIFRDGTGRLRPAQVGACSFEELRDALASARIAGIEHFVLLSHNFEMMKQGRSEPDSVVVNRFETLCKHLADHCSHFPVATFGGLENVGISANELDLPSAGLLSTIKRHGEQAWRRVAG